MKLNRRSLRRLIESVINEENPGSKFGAAVKRGKENKRNSQKKKATEELQKTYDWFERVVFPAIEDNAWPIKADDDYHTMFSSANAHEKRKLGMMSGKLGMISKGTIFKSVYDDISLRVKKTYCHPDRGPVLYMSVSWTEEGA